MNPFDWAGPPFLVFYFLSAAVLVGLQVWRRNRRESTPGERVNLSDAYLLAFLKGKDKSLAQSALASLIARHHVVNDDHAQLVAAVLPEAVKQSADKAIVELLRSPCKAAEVVQRICQADVFAEAVAAMASRAESARLIAGAELNRARRLDSLVSILLLVGVAGAKIALAISRGRANYRLLIALCVMECLGVLVLLRGRRLTRLGEKTLADAAVLYEGMPSRVRSTKRLSSQEVAVTAGLFGIATLGASTLEDASVYRRIQPMAAGGGGMGGSTTSCGSSSSSCSSSSCGGGGGGSSCGGCSSS